MIPEDQKNITTQNSEYKNLTSQKGKADDEFHGDNNRELDMN